MARFILENGQVKVVIDEMASEIHSFTRKGREYMWSGDPKYWSGRNPTLFPMVGRTWDGLLHIDGKTYTTGNHGFTRNSLFKGKRVDEATVTMELCESDETLKQYPFAFRLVNTYHLEENTLSIATTIANEKEKVLPFHFGYHPAFACPSFSTWRLECSGKGQSTKYIALDAERLNETIILERPLFDTYTLTDGIHGVSVGAAQYPWVAFWSPKAPFVCIEPWYSHTDFGKVEVPFDKREGAICLEKGKEWHAQYSISVF